MNTMFVIYGYRVVGDEWKSLHLYQSFTAVEFFYFSLPHPKTHVNNKGSLNVANLPFKWYATTTFGEKILCLRTCFGNQKIFHMKMKCLKWKLSLFPSVVPWYKIVVIPISYVIYFHVIYFYACTKSSVNKKNLKIYHHAPNTFAPNFKINEGIGLANLHITLE